MMRLRDATALLACLLLLSCSSFERHWEVAALAGGGESGATGAWEGRWFCELTGHEGELLCLVSPVTQDVLELSFRAGWSVFETEHAVVVTASRSPHGRSFSGKHDLGFWFGGECRFEGVIDDDLFVTHYVSEEHRGRFVLRRPR